MEELEAALLESPTWKHRLEDNAPEPFDVCDEHDDIIDMSLLKM